MKTTVNETTVQETEQILQLNRPLLSIGEYADREGITRGLIEECGKLGIVPIRRHKGKTFIVDVPIHSYSGKDEIALAPVRAAGKTTQAGRISRLAEKCILDTPGVDDRSMQFAADIDSNGTVFKSIQKDFPERLEITNEQTAAIDSEIELTEEIAQLHTRAIEATDRSVPFADDNKDPEIVLLKSAQTDSPESPETTDQPMTEPDRTSQPETLPEIIQTPELQVSEIIDDLPDFADETIQIQDVLESVETAQSDGVQVGILAARARSKRLWQITAVLSFVCFCTAVFTSFWLYMDRRVQLDRLDQAYAGFQKVYADYTQAGKNTKTIQNELDNSKNREKQIQNELDNSIAEAKKTRDELALTRQNFQTTRQYNVEAAQQLNEQIQGLTTRLTNLTKNP
ncbi:MAG: hypothetical protein ACYS1A_06715 [Planctomycetota bacterium]|jgi:hypothetical protein